ncbi:YceH family protein [Verrucomicrobiota bacterium sgz303538]
MAHFELSPVETRILGCLLEKERLTPENYPLSPNGLTAACNQSTNREPVMSLEERTVEDGVNSLREKKLAMVVHQAGARVQKYRHTLPDHYDLSAKEVALLCVLMLRGPQTPGELRARTERMHPFGSLEEVEACLTELSRGDDPLVRVYPARPGQKERRFVQILSGEPGDFDSAASSAVSQEGALPRAGTGARVDALEQEVSALRTELQQLREEFAAFRKQFE